MIKISLTSESIKSLTRNRLLTQKISQAYRQTAYGIGKELHSWLLKDMKKPKTGRLYKQTEGVSGKLKNARLKRASAEDETPAIRTGNFRKSVNFQVLGNTKLIWGSGQDGFATKYNKALEFGSKNMKARQPLQRAMNANEGKLRALAINKIKQAYGGFANKK